MLNEKKITENFGDYEKLKQLYAIAFPKAERIPLKQLMEQGGDTELVACYDGEIFCGFYSALTVGDITHILYLAIVEKLRDHGYGSRILGLISDRYKNNRIIVDIEAEDAEAPNAKQRIMRKAFYEKNGYTESGIKYVWRNVPYKILVKNGKISKREFDGFWDKYEKL